MRFKLISLFVAIVMFSGQILIVNTFIEKAEKKAAKAMGSAEEILSKATVMMEEVSWFESKREDDLSQVLSEMRDRLISLGDNGGSTKTPWGRYKKAQLILTEATGLIKDAKTLIGKISTLLEKKKDIFKSLNRLKKALGEIQLKIKVLQEKLLSNRHFYLINDVYAVENDLRDADNHLSAASNLLAEVEKILPAENDRGGKGDPSRVIPLLRNSKKEIGKAKVEIEKAAAYLQELEKGRLLDGQAVLDLKRRLTRIKTRLTRALGRNHPRNLTNKILQEQRRIEEIDRLISTGSRNYILILQLIQGAKDGMRLIEIEINRGY